MKPLEQSSKDLLACPFCRNDKAMRVGLSEDVYHQEDCECLGDSEDYFAVFCDASTDLKLGGCGASSGFKKTAALAIEAWNRRAEPPLDAALSQGAKP